jgi:hypothetical protein
MKSTDWWRNQNKDPTELKANLWQNAYYAMTRPLMVKSSFGNQ